MKTQLLVLILCMCSTHFFFAQEDNGVMALQLPVRNSLTFNRFVINPTFSFVREQNKYISLYNKREWVQFDDAPLTYLTSYSGRFAENIGAGIGLFQQNYGVLTTFGGVVNFAYNARLARESNLTFGLNIGAYKSGINTSKVISNLSDPSVQNVPENFLLSINPGINLGLTFLDFGISVNNLVTYNFNTSTILENNPEQSLQAHVMYTGYMDSRGFFDQTKFSGLVRSEFKKDETIISALAMLTIPKGIWAQAGYNTVYGLSGGIGLNITQEIALEYNFEKSVGDLVDFGSSHGITLAYRFKNKENYNYSSGDEVVGLISNIKRKRSSASKISKEQQAAIQKIAEERKDRILAERNAKQENKEETGVKAKEEAEEKAKQLAAQKAKEEAEEKAKQLAAQKAKEEAEERAKQLAAQKAKEEAEERAKQLATQKAKEEAEEKAKQLAAQKAKEEAEERAKEELITNPKDELGKEMNAIAQKAEYSKTKQDKLLQQLDDLVEIKNQDLKDLKEENDLNEQGIEVAPKPFKSITEENNRLQTIKANLDSEIESRDNQIKELKELYDDRFNAETIYLEEVSLFYRKTLERLTTEQKQIVQAKLNLETRLENIRIATEFERNRRIKRAAFDNESDRYEKDRATLQNIKKITEVSNQQFKAEDFDFGEEQPDNIQILKNISHVEEGYYLIVAVHREIDKRDDFVTKVIASGQADVDFFYDTNTSKYYIYYNKFNNLQDANTSLQEKGSLPYNTKMSIVKIEK